MRLYRSTPALHQQDFSDEGFEWIDCNDTESSTLVVAAQRQWFAGRCGAGCVQLHTGCRGDNFRVGVPRGGQWLERLNSDARDYGGGGIGNFGSGGSCAPALRMGGIIR